MTPLLPLIYWCLLCVPLWIMAGALVSLRRAAESNVIVVVHPENKTPPQTDDEIPPQKDKQQ